MTNCQLSLLSHLLSTAWVTAGIVGLVAICLVLITRVLAREGSLETS